MAGINDLRGLLQPEWFYDSITGVESTHGDEKIMILAGLCF